MARLFVAIPLPDDVKQQISTLCGGVPGARWQTPGQMHLTLRFVGEVDAANAADIGATLSAICGEAFTLELSGVGVFGPPARERLLWAGVRPCGALTDLHDRVESALVREDRMPDRRKFHPHVTIARLNAVSEERLNDFVAAQSAYQSRAFRVDEFALFSSVLSKGGAVYTVEARYPLGALDPVPTEYAFD